MCVCVCVCVRLYVAVHALGARLVAFSVHCVLVISFEWQCFIYTQ